MKYYVLYNPAAGRGEAKAEAERLSSMITDGELVYEDLTTYDEGIDELLSRLEREDKIILCGGDGTLNRFVNKLAGKNVQNEILYFACGSGNDFLRDVKENEVAITATGEDGAMLVDMTPYIQKLPQVKVEGKSYYFLNGVGYGIDGYCCEVGDELRKKTEKPINYAGIAIKGLLFHYKPTQATVIVDGKEYSFKNVWLAPTMNGKYYGGGMIPAPEQRRENDDISVMVFHGKSKLKTLMIFPSLFKGEHVKKTKNVSVFSGKEITVKFNEPRTLQIDGETVIGVTEYTARK